MICKNCGNEFEGKFCNQCGQKNIEGRLTIKEALHNFFHEFTHLDRGLFFLIQELSYRPGHVTKDYIEGKRKSYFNPLQFLILAVAVSTFLTINFHLLGTKIDPDSIPGLTEAQVSGLRYNNFMYKYFNLVLFAAVPVSAFFSWLIFKKSGYNYAENLIFNSFLAGERTVFFIALSPFLYLFRNYWYIVIGLYYLSWNVYFAFAYKQFFGGKTLVIILKYIITFILFFAVLQLGARAIFNLIYTGSLY